MKSSSYSFWHIQHDKKMNAIISFYHMLILYRATIFFKVIIRNEW